MNLEYLQEIQWVLCTEHLILKIDSEEMKQEKEIDGLKEQNEKIEQQAKEKLAMETELTETKLLLNKTKEALDAEIKRRDAASAAAAADAANKAELVTQKARAEEDLEKAKTAEAAAKAELEVLQQQVEELKKKLEAEALKDKAPTKVQPPPMKETEPYQNGVYTYYRLRVEEAPPTAEALKDNDQMKTLFTSKLQVSMPSNAVTHVRDHKTSAHAVMPFKYETGKCSFTLFVFDDVTSYYDMYYCGKQTPGNKAAVKLHYPPNFQ
jgi:hypothetical protein